MISVGASVHVFCHEKSLVFGSTKVILGNKCHGTSVTESVFIRHSKKRGVYQLCWKEQGREHAKGFNIRQEAE